VLHSLSMIQDNVHHPVSDPELPTYCARSPSRRTLCASTWHPWVSGRVPVPTLPGVRVAGVWCVTGVSFILVPPATPHYAARLLCKRPEQEKEKKKRRKK